MRLGVFSAVLVMLVAVRAEAESVSTTPSASLPVPSASPSVVPALPPATTPTPPNRAERSPGDRPPRDASPAQKAAEPHFERALSWYRSGKYRRALEELDQALVYDPEGKDLVFNLALVQEKLGDLEGAIRSLERFQGMEKDPNELERTAQTMERLRGARAEMLALEPRNAPSAPLPCPAPRARGRFDGWVIGSASAAVASFLVGTVFAVRALSTDNAASARDSALISDLGFSGSLLFGAGSVALYLGREALAVPARAARLAPLPGATNVRFNLHF